MYYLKSDVYIEPLVNNWYAWANLISPLSYARYLHKTHRRIMKNFVKNYHLHILASQEKVLTGGEFLDCKESQLDDIKGLIQKIDNELDDVISLSESVDILNEVLKTYPKGLSLEPLYSDMPEPLKGYVELVYDLNHNASFRLIEPLLYKSSYYKPKLQTFSLGRLGLVGERPFVFSTPRLQDEHHIHLDIEFNHKLAHLLLSSRDKPLSEKQLYEIAERQLAFDGAPDLKSFFTEETPNEKTQVNPGTFRMKYTGHAGFLLESQSANILIDPVIASKSNASDAPITFDDLPEKIHYVCITHNHQDHINIETLLQLRHKVEQILIPKSNGGTMFDPSLKQVLKALHFNCIEFDELDDLVFPNGVITSIPFLGEHGDLDIRSKTAWLVELFGKRILFAADSSNLEPKLYEHVENLTGKVDILAIGMECVGAPYTWIYGAFYSEQVPRELRESRRLNGSDNKQAFEIVKAFNAEQVFIYALGLEKCFKYFMGIEYSEDSRQLQETEELIKSCRVENIPVERLCGRKSIEFDV